MNLKRLCLCLLALTLALGSVSSFSLFRIGRNFDRSVHQSEPGLAWISEMTLRLGQAQSSLHRSISSTGRADIDTLSPVEWLTVLEEGSLPFTPSFSRSVRDQTTRLEGLAKLAGEALEGGEWEDLQIIMRDADNSWNELYEALNKEQARLHELVVRRGKRVSWTIRVAGALIALCLVLAALIAAGLYLNWRRLERKVLGIE